MSWLSLVPAWVGWLLALLLVAGGQELRVQKRQGDLLSLQALQLDTRDRLSACRETRGALLAQVDEQNAALADLRSMADARSRQAEQAQGAVREQAQVEYQAANRLQQERIGGDACAAASVLIDRELAL